MNSINTEASSSAREERFTKFLERLYERDDRAALAALRRGLGRAPGEASEMHCYVVPRVQGLNVWQENAYYITAALFALHPGRSWRASDGAQQSTNLGASLGKMARKNKESASIERRFVALLNARAEELPTHLRNVVSLLKSKEISIDWTQLLKDVNNWNRESRRVQRDWARAFWSSMAGTDAASGPVISDGQADSNAPDAS